MRRDPRRKAATDHHRKSEFLRDIHPTTTKKYKGTNKCKKY
jgi:hypothetical protein